jgi:hypothetical protein
MILSYIPDQLLVGQTCRKFYDLSCSLESYSLTIRTKILEGDPKMEVTKFLEDESIFSSIIDSKRRIEKLNLESLDLDPPNDLKLQRIIENFGARIKTLTVSDCRLSMEDIAKLNSMPQLEFIELESVDCKNYARSSNFRLNLPKLKMLDISYCAEEALEFFDHLPDDILEKVEISDIKADSSNKWFANQRKLKSVCVMSCSFEPLDMDQLKLKKLTTDSVGEKLKLMLKKQESLKTLSLVSNISQGDFNFICSHLPSLDQLKFTASGNNINDFSSLSDLKQLKTFKVRQISEASLRSIKSCSVETIKISLKTGNMNEETVIALSANCPSMVNLNISSTNDDDAINLCLKNFPQLKTFSCIHIYHGYNFPYGLKHQNLNKLKINDFELSIGMLFLFGCLENLEVFKTEAKIDWQDLKAMLNAPKLKALCLKQFPIVDEGFVETLKENGKNLESVHVHEQYKDGFDVDNVHFSPEELREKFKDQFPVFSLRPVTKWTMKKSNKPKICCDN